MPLSNQRSTPARNSVASRCTDSQIVVSEFLSLSLGIASIVSWISVRIASASAGSSFGVLVASKRPVISKRAFRNERDARYDGLSLSLPYPLMSEWE
jgi:hypothetical protein